MDTVSEDEDDSEDSFFGDEEAEEEADEVDARTVRVVVLNLCLLSLRIWKSPSYMIC